MYKGTYISLTDLVADQFPPRKKPLFINRISEHKQWSDYYEQPCGLSWAIMITNVYHESEFSYNCACDLNLYPLITTAEVQSTQLP